MNRVFQERLDELEAELFDTGVLKEEGTVSDAVITTFVPPSLETRLGMVPAVRNYRQQSSSEPGQRTDVQDRLGEAPMRRAIHPRRRIGPVNPIEEIAGTSRSDTRSETKNTSRDERRPSRGSLMWSRPIPSPWHIYKDELMKLDLQRVSFIEDARRMLDGATLSVSRFYSITDVDWLIAASINFSSTTALRFADLEGLPSNNTMGPVNARPLQDVRLNHDEGNREERPGREIISAPNRMIEMENLRPLKAELPAVWSDISNAMGGLKDHALHMLVLDEVLGLELSNFSRQLKLKPGIDDDHRVIAAMSNDLRFRAMEVAGEDTRRKNSLETRAHLEAMVLRTKPEANQWLHLNPRVAALGADAFEQGPVMITKIHAYLLKEVNLAENAGEKTAEFVNRMCQITLETFGTQEVKGQEGFERTDSMLEGLGAGWTTSFLAKVYPKVSHYLIKEFLQAVVEVSIVELIALFVTFGAESFVKGPAILLTDGIQNLRLDGLLTLIAITHGNLGGLMKLARCPEQMRERVRNLDMKKSTDSWNKIRDLRHTLIQYLLQQNRFGTGEDETIEREEDVRRHVGGMPLLTDLSLDQNRSLGADQRSHGVRDSDLWTSSHVCVS